MSTACLAGPLPVPTDTYFNQETSARARRAASRRAASGRRRLVDPTTCERDYSAEELEFMRAMDAYKRRSGRPFPTWSETLEVLRSLGYAKVDATGFDSGGAR